MLPLKPFAFVEPDSLATLSDELRNADENCKLMAGGTDLVPNLKHGLYDITRIISLRRVKEIQFVDVSDSHLTLGALVKLRAVGDHPAITTCAPALSRASLSIASPQIRNMGTVGGNICLDTRCLYINQTEFWRSALGFCLKKDGCVCHVVKTGKRCVAAASNDLATVLLAYNARVTVMSPDDRATMALDDFYTANGEKNTIISPKQYIADVTIPLSTTTFAGFYKVRMRESIDFPLISVAICFSVSEGVMRAGRLVVNALVAKPKILDLAQFANFRYNRELVEGIADFAFQKCHPQTNLAGDVQYRKHMVHIAVKRACDEAITVSS